MSRKNQSAASAFRSEPGCVTVYKVLPRQSITATIRRTYKYPVNPGLPALFAFVGATPSWVWLYGRPCVLGHREGGAEMGLKRNYKLRYGGRGTSSCCGIRLARPSDSTPNVIFSFTYQLAPPLPPPSSFLHSLFFLSFPSTHILPLASPFSSFFFIFFANFTFHMTPSFHFLIFLSLFFPLRSFSLPPPPVLHVP